MITTQAVAAYTSVAQAGGPRSPTAPAFVGSTARTGSLPLTPPSSGVAAPDRVGGSASAAAARIAALGANASPSANVQLSPLASAAGAAAALSQAAAASPNASTTAADRSRRIAEAIAVLNQSIGSLAQLDDDDGRALAFLSNARLSQRLLAAGLTDSVNGRSSNASLESIGLTALPTGGFQIDRGRLEQALRDNPAGVRALITDYARNLDGFFAERAGLTLGVPGLDGLGGQPGGPLGGPLSGQLTGQGRSGDGAALDALGNFNTQRALNAFRRNALF